MNDETTTPHYHVGHNMPGYLPESDVFYASDLATAKAYMIADLLHEADYDENYGDELAGLAEDVNLAGPSGWDDQVGNLAWWITPCADEDCADEQY